MTFKSQADTRGGEWAHGPRQNMPNVDTGVRIVLVSLQLCIAFATSWSRMSKKRIQDLRKFRVRHMALTDQSMLGTRQRQCVSFPRVPLAGFKGP